ncbi:Crp/Fnr family transcriptional regulator [Bacteroidota bacterium]
MNQDFISCECKGCELKELFFENIKEKEITSICNSKQEKTYFRGDIIINEGDEIKHFMYLKEGLVKLYRNAGDRDQIITFAGPLDFVSILSIFSDSNFHYSVSALEDSVVCYLDIKTVNQIANQNSKFAVSLLKKMSNLSDNLIKTVLDIRRKNLRGRIAYVLIYFSEEVYKTNSFDLPVSRKEIAEMIEMTTENVIRILSEFRKDAILKIFGKTIEIVEMERLKRICNFG